LYKKFNLGFPILKGFIPSFLKHSLMSDLEYNLSNLEYFIFLSYLFTHRCDCVCCDWNYSGVIKLITVEGESVLFSEVAAD